MVSSAYAMAKPPPPPKELQAVDIEKIVKSLLKAEKVIIRRSKAVADIDNDGREELVVLCSVSGKERPADAEGKIVYEKDGIKLSSDLMILAQDDSGKYYFKAYYINPFRLSSDPSVFLKDINSDNKMEIFLSLSDINKKAKYQYFIIFAYDNGKLVPVKFKGGHFTRNGVPTFPGPGQLSISYSGVSDTYTWNQNGYFELVSTTALRPTQEEQKVIDYLSSNITDIVHGKPVLGSTTFGVYEVWFYPGEVVVAKFEDGHIGGQFLGKYKIKGEDLQVIYLDENFGLLDEFRDKHKLSSIKPKEYFYHKGVFIGR